MEIGYYPGCSLRSTAREFDISLKAMCRLLGITLAEIPDWICCGTSPVHVSSQELSYVLPYKNLEKAAKQGIKELLIPCPSCLYSIHHTQEACEKDIETKNRLFEITGYLWERGLRIYHLLDFLRDFVTLEDMKEKVKRPLHGLKVAVYYGCLTRFFPAVYEDGEQPELFERVIETLGAEAVSWPGKIDCCGAGLSLTRPDIVKRLVGELLAGAKRGEADCFAVVCPLCQSNLDLRQRGITMPSGAPYSMPVIYLTQLVALALGDRGDRLGLEKLMVDARPLLKSKNLL